MHSTTIIIIAVASVGVLSIMLCCCILYKDRTADQDQVDRWKRVLGTDMDKNDLESGRATSTKTKTKSKKPVSESTPSEPHSEPKPDITTSRPPSPPMVEPKSMQ
ncbi:hypothetical protein BGZ52_001435 [Haplosporangium bisporale]|nr:hypothetical protein BGZ52_001435 [Haplosporangium bisporale]